MIFFNETLGLRSAGEGSVTLETRDEHQVAPGIIHFAVLATVAEVSAAGAVGGSAIPTGVELHLLQAAKPGTLEGKGTVLRKGKHSAVAEGEVRQGGTLVAKAVVTFSIR